MDDASHIPSDAEKVERPIYEMPDGRAAQEDGVGDSVRKAAKAAGRATQDVVRATAEALKAASSEVSKAVAAVSGQRPAPRVIVPRPKRVSTAMRICWWGYLLFIFGISLVYGFVMGVSTLSPMGLLTGLIMTAMMFGLSYLCFKRLRLALLDWQTYQTLPLVARAVEALGERDRVSVRELAQRCGTSQQRVRNVCAHAISRGHIPVGYLGAWEGQETLFLTQDAIDEAIARDSEAPASATKRVSGARPAASGGAREGAATAVRDGAGGASDRTDKDVASGNAGATDGAADPDASGDRVAAVRRQCAAYQERVRAANDMIADEEMSAKLDEQVELVGRIAAAVEDDEDAANDLGQFTSYYLPTTQRLIETYADLDLRGEDGPNAMRMRGEISSTLDVVNAAFENLIEDLLQEQSWDLSSDMSVLRTMLAQDGLSGRDELRPDDLRPDAAPVPDASVGTAASPNSQPTADRRPT